MTSPWRQIPATAGLKAYIEHVRGPIAPTQFRSGFGPYGQRVFDQATSAFIDTDEMDGSRWERGTHVTSGVEPTGKINYSFPSVLNDDDRSGTEQSRGDMIGRAFMWWAVPLEAKPIQGFFWPESSSLNLFAPGFGSYVGPSVEYEDEITGELWSLRGTALAQVVDYISGPGDPAEYLTGSVIVAITFEEGIATGSSPF